jgi:hypothetical protein
MASRLPALPLFLLIFIRILSFSLPAFAQSSPAVADFSDCFSGNESVKLSVSTVYAQIAENDNLGKHLNLTVLGQSPQEIIGLANGSGSLGPSHTPLTSSFFPHHPSSHSVHHHRCPHLHSLAEQHLFLLLTPSTLPAQYQRLRLLSSTGRTLRIFVSHTIELEQGTLDPSNTSPRGRLAQ